MSDATAPSGESERPNQRNKDKEQECCDNRFDTETESEESEDENAAEGNMIAELGFTKIVSLSTALWSKVVASTGVESLDVKEFSDRLSELREFFVCTVCEKLVSSKFIITSVPTTTCTFLHLVCEDCQDKEWKKPCDHHPSASVDPVGTEYSYLKEIVDSYKGFCSLFIQTPECRKLIELKTETDAEFDALTFVNHLTEGALATVSTVSENLSSSQDEDESTDDESLNFTSNDDSSPVKVEESECDSMSYSDMGSSDDCAEEIEETPTTSSGTCNNSDPESPVPSFPNSCEPLHLISLPNSQRWPEANEVAKYASGSIGIGLLHSPTYVARLSWGNSSTPPQSTLPNSAKVVRALAGTDKKLKIRSPKKLSPLLGVPKSQSESRIPRKGCRCGNATSNPGKLTCCGQRCPCYVARKICVGCRCKGCRNPHLPDGKKRLPPLSQEITSATLGSKSITPFPTNSNSVAFQTIPEVPTTFTSLYPVASYATFPVPVQVPISIVGISSLIQSTQSDQFPHSQHQLI